MCNECRCDDYEKCSIVGNIPLGFCCPKCDFYNGEHTCLRAKMKLEEEKKETLVKTQLLHRAFSGSKSVSKKELEKFP